MEEKESLRNSFAWHSGVFLQPVGFAVKTQVFYMFGLDKEAEDW